MSSEESATREALERLRLDGSDLKRPMSIDFFVVTPDERSGHTLALRASALGFTTSVEYDADDAIWTCYCTKTVIPDLGTVIDIERQLDRLASDLGGYADGFGSFGNADSK